jgi:hypothetical protein
MVELFQSYQWQPVRVIVGTKNECTTSLIKYPNFIAEQVVGLWIHKYLYQATEQEIKDFIALRDEHVR